MSSFGFTDRCPHGRLTKNIDMALDTNVSCKEICRVCHNRNVPAKFHIERIPTSRDSHNVAIVSNGSRHIYIIRNLFVKVCYKFDISVCDIM